MDKLLRYGDLQAALQTAMRAQRAETWTALPGVIESFDAGAQTCAVQLAVTVQLRGDDGSMSSVPLPLLTDCPAQFPSGGNCTMTFPVAPGDECLVVFSSRCIDAWWQSGGVQEQAENRMHSLSDGFALLGFRSAPRVLANVSTTSAQLRSDDGATFVDLNPTAGTINFIGTLSANGKRIDDTHTHGGVEPGPGNSGTVN